MISYDKLWQTMKEKGVTQYALIKKYNISPGQITRLKRNESVSTHTIEIFCKILKCNVEDIMQYIDDENVLSLCRRRSNIFKSLGGNSENFKNFFTNRFIADIIPLYASATRLMD